MQARNQMVLNIILDVFKDDPELISYSPVLRYHLVKLCRIYLNEFHIAIHTLLHEYYTILIVPEHLQSKNQMPVEDNRVQNIQNSIVSCMDLFQDIAYPKENKEACDAYLSITKRLAEFWYDEGMSLMLGELPSLPADEASKQSDVQLQVEKNVEVLKYVFLAHPGHLQIIERGCYTNLLQNLNPGYKRSVEELNQFSLEKIVSEKPSDFIRLFNYLFNENASFNGFLKDKKSTYLNVAYHYALFHIYVAEAFKKADPSNEQVKQLVGECREIAKDNLLDCLQNKSEPAENLLYRFFSDDINVQVKMAIIFLKINHPNKEEWSHSVYRKIHDVEYNEIAKIKEIHDLFYHWMVSSERADLKAFAVRYIEQAAVKGDDVAYCMLSQAAEKDISYTEVLVRATIASKDKGLCEALYEAMQDRDHEQDPAIWYWMYQVAKEAFQDVGEEDYEFLLLAANHDYAPAIGEVRALTVKGASERNKVINLAMKNLNSYCEFSLELLSELYSRGELCFTSHLYRKVDVFYTYYLHRAKGKHYDKAISDLKEYVFADSRQALDLLFKKAKLDLPIAMFVARFLFQNFSAGRNIISTREGLKKLQKKLNLYYSHDHSAEISYCRYIFKRHFETTIDLSLLFPSCELGYEPGILSLVEIVDLKEDVDIEACVRFLEKIANGEHYHHKIAESLCVYYARCNLWEKSHEYFNDFCHRFNMDPKIIYTRMKDENCFISFYYHSDHPLIKLIPAQYKSSISAIQFMKYEVGRDEDRFVNLDLLFSIDCYSAWDELDQIIHAERQVLSSFSVTVYDFHYAAPLSCDVTNQVVQACLDELKECAFMKGSPFQTLAAEALCCYWASHQNYKKAEIYFEICAQHHFDQLYKLCDRLRRKNYYYLFLKNCSNEMLTKMKDLGFDVGQQNEVGISPMLNGVRFFDRFFGGDLTNTQEQSHHVEYKR